MNRSKGLRVLAGPGSAPPPARCRCWHCPQPEPGGPGSGEQQSACPCVPHLAVGQCRPHLCSTGGLPPAPGRAGGWSPGKDWDASGSLLQRVLCHLPTVCLGGRRAQAPHTSPTSLLCLPSFLGLLTVPFICTMSFLTYFCRSDVSLHGGNGCNHLTDGMAQARRGAGIGRSWGSCVAPTAGQGRAPAGKMDCPPLPSLGRSRSSWLLTGPALSVCGFLENKPEWQISVSAFLINKVFKKREGKKSNMTFPFLPQRDRQLLHLLVSSLNRCSRPETWGLHAGLPRA